MTTILGFKDIIDLPDWVPMASSISAHSTGGGVCSDLRNSEDRIPLLFQLALATQLNVYSVKGDGWALVVNPVLSALGSGASLVFAPQRGPRGTISTGNTTTSVVLSTALPGAVAANQLANRCDGMGFKVRIIGIVSGKTEERIITSNTSGTTPTLTFSPALSFTPQSGDSYEFLSGRVYMMGGGALAAGTWKAFDVLTNTLLSSLSNTNLPATISSDTSLVVLDELHVPATNAPGEGFLTGAGDGGVAGRALVATAATATTLTGQTTNGDAAVLVNEYRNFQLRIVKDTGTPTAVGQRRKITSHTAGASPVYTVPTWTVTPSATAQYVVENANEVLAFTSAVTTVYTYTSDIVGTSTADSWSSTTYGARGSAISSGVSSWQPFGMTLDAAKNARYSHVFSFRGGNVTALDVLDVAGGANGSWSNGITYGNSGPLIGLGSCAEVDPLSGYAYINQNAVNLNYRFDSKNRVLEAWPMMRWAQSTAVVGSRMGACVFVDPVGGQRLTMLLQNLSSSVNLFASLAQR